MVVIQQLYGYFGQESHRHPQTRLVGIAQSLGIELAVIPVLGCFSETPAALDC